MEWRKEKRSGPGRKNQGNRRGWCRENKRWRASKRGREMKILLIENKTASDSPTKFRVSTHVQYSGVSAWKIATGHEAHARQEKRTKHLEWKYRITIQLVDQRANWWEILRCAWRGRCATRRDLQRADEKRRADTLRREREGMTLTRGKFELIS